MQRPGDQLRTIFPHRGEALLVGAVLIVHLIFSVGFSLGPIFEGPDELEHFRFIQTVARTGALPNALGTRGTQYHHAPLYYVLAAPFAAFATPVDLTEYVETSSNPFYGYAFFTPGNDNKNSYLHPRAEDFPYSGSAALIVHLPADPPALAWGRFSPTMPYSASRPDHRPAAGGAGVRGVPAQSVYLSGTLTNDILLMPRRRWCCGCCCASFGWDHPGAARRCWGWRSARRCWRRSTRCSWRSLPARRC
jgi:hypothetical protein